MKRHLRTAVWATMKTLAAAVLCCGALVLLTGSWRANDERIINRTAAGLMAWQQWTLGYPIGTPDLSQLDSNHHVNWCLHVMQQRAERPLNIVSLHAPNLILPPPAPAHFQWGSRAALLAPGRLWVVDPTERWPKADVVLVVAVAFEGLWRGHLEMDQVHERFPHELSIRGISRIQVTPEHLPLLAGLEDHERATTLADEVFPVDAAALADRRAARATAGVWAVLFLTAMTLQGWLLLRWTGVLRRGGHLAVGWWLPMAMALGLVMEVALLWAVGVLGLEMGPTLWRWCHEWLVPGLALTLFLGRAGPVAMSGGSSASDLAGAGPGASRHGAQAVRTMLGWALIPVVVLLVVLMAGPGPLNDSPGLVRDGFKARLFFDHGGITPAALSTDGGADLAGDRAFLRAGYPPAWPGVTYAMALWCGGFEAAPLRILPALLLGLALLHLATLAAAMLRPADLRGWLKLGFLWLLLAAMALSPPLLTSYPARFHGEPFMLLTLTTAWGLWLRGAVGLAERLPWGTVIVAAVLLGAACWVKREGLLWAALCLPFLPLMRGMDLRRWAASAGLVLGMALPVIGWRRSVGTPMEDFSRTAWFDLETAERMGRAQEAWTEVSTWLWSKGPEAYGLMVPVALAVWCLGIATKKWGSGLKQCLKDSLWLLLLVAGGIAAVTAMFQFSTVDPLRYHLTAVWRLLLPVAIAAFLLATRALTPSHNHHSIDHESQSNHP